MVEFRRSLAASFLFRFFLLTSYQLAADATTFQHSIKDTYKSAVKPYDRPPARGIQYFSGVPDEDVVGKPYHHMSADMQVSGEAQYVDDIPLPSNALHAAFVLSTQPHAKILSVDYSAATAALGVEGYFGAEDVPGDNAIGAIIHDEELFATTEVTCVGQLIGVVVADTEAHARAGARLVRVEYADLPAILSTTQWVGAPPEERKCFEGFGHRIDLGDVDAEFSSGSIEHVVEGQARVGGQEHFYLEPNCAIVIPREADEIEAFSSSQCPSKNQEQIHSVLGIPMHKVTVRTKRLGGGFGGKESRAAFVNAAIAVPAWHLRRPVRVVLDRDEDMQIMGQRHAFVGDYKVGFSKEGKIAALDLALYCNSGNSLDLTVGIMDRALAHTDNAYFLPAVRAIGCCSFTHQASNTAYRGFGGPQGMMVTEMWIDRIARTVGKSPEEVRLLNMYHENDLTHYRQLLDGCQLRPCWQHVMETSDFMQRRAAAEKYNAGSRFRKRGLALIPTKFGISFTTLFLNQGAALVNVYTDGTVLVTHGGVEMGQGLHTKVAQAAAHDLGIPLSSVFIAETATDKVPNASPTAASASSDIYGGAVSDACTQLNTRLLPYRVKLGPTATFAEVAKAAHMERVDLSAHGFYKTPDITGFGGNRPFNYFTYGAVASEVELDTLTGDFQVLRTDICMDVGKSMNPAIDIGQVEGGFVQGMGWSCIEELIWGDDEHKWVRPGTLHTRGPGTYKIPTANDIPLDLRVTLLKDAPNGRTPQAHSSKAIGEPPFFLGAAVFFALKEAVYSARADAGHHGWFELDLPCTPERLRMACPDHLTAPFAAHDIRPKLSC